MGNWNKHEYAQLLLLKSYLYKCILTKKQNKNLFLYEINVFNFLCKCCWWIFTRIFLNLFIICLKGYSIEHYLHGQEAQHLKILCMSIRAQYHIKIYWVYWYLSYLIHIVTLPTRARGTTFKNICMSIRALSYQSILGVLIF